MVSDKGVSGNCPKCGSSAILEIIIDGHPTIDEINKVTSKFGAHHLCSQCNFSPTLEKDNDTAER